MKRRVGWGLTLVICTAADAAEPVATPLEPAATTAAEVAPAPKPAPAPAAKPSDLAKPLDLRVGNVRNYMMPNEYRAALDAPDADKNTVVVEATRDLLSMEFEQPVPSGIVAPFWALANPLQSWRVFLPDLNRREERPREPEDKVPPPIFRWGP